VTQIAQFHRVNFRGFSFVAKVLADRMNHHDVTFRERSVSSVSAVRLKARTKAELSPIGKR